MYVVLLTSAVSPTGTGIVGPSGSATCSVFASPLGLVICRPTVLLTCHVVPPESATGTGTLSSPTGSTTSSVFASPLGLVTCTVAPASPNYHCLAADDVLA